MKLGLYHQIYKAMKRLFGLLVLILALQATNHASTLDFTPARNIVSCGPNTVYFVCKDTLDLNDLIYWDFGDGTGANVVNPAHTYTETGSYTVKLIVIKDGVKDSITKDHFVTINPAPLAQMKIESKPEMNNCYVFTSQSVHNADSFSSLVWHINETELSGKSVSYVFSEEGEYEIRLVATNNKGCSHESSSTIKVKPVVIEPVGVKENELAQLSVYPNPAKDLVVIKEGTVKNITQITLTDILGKQHAVSVSSLNEHLAINTTLVKPGVYFLTLKTASSEITKRIIVEQ